MPGQVTGASSRRQLREQEAFRRARRRGTRQSVARTARRVGIVLGLVAVGAGALTGAYSALSTLGERRVQLAQASGSSEDGRITPVGPSRTTPSASSTSASPSTTASAPRAAVRWTGVTAAEQHLTDVAYGQASGAQVMDLHLPARTGSPVPVVVLIHGGGFSEGDKSEHADLVDPLLAKGFAVANLNYRLSGEAAFPAGGQDVKAAVRWLRTNAARYGLDGARFGAWGDSAGGYLAVMLGLTGDQRSVFDPTSGGSASTAVQAVVDWYGPVDFASMDSQAASNGCDAAAQTHSQAGSPESNWLGGAITEIPTTLAKATLVRYAATAQHLPPFRVVHGGADCTVATGQSRQLITALKARGAKATLQVLDGVGHGGPAFDGEIDDAVAFLSSALR